MSNPGDKKYSHTNQILELKNFEIFVGNRNLLDNIEMKNIILPNKLKEITIYAPISCEPSPPILSIIATVVVLIEKIMIFNSDLSKKIKIKFLFWGNLIYDNEEIKSEFKRHFAMYLPDTKDTTLQNLIRLQQEEFKTIIQNIFFNIMWTGEFSLSKIDQLIFLNFFKEEKNRIEILDKEYFEDIFDTVNKSLFIDTDISFQKKMLEIYLYNNPDPNYKYPTFIEIALEMLNDLTTENDSTSFLVLQETGYNMISHLITESKIKQKYGSINETVLNSIIWYKELDRGSSPFPIYYNELSKNLVHFDYLSIDELYFAEMLKNLNCRLFLLNTDGMSINFNEIAKQINRFRKDINDNNSLYTNVCGPDGKTELTGIQTKIMTELEKENENICKFYETFLSKKFKDEVFNSIEYGFLDSQQLIIQQFDLII